MSRRVVLVGAVVGACALVATTGVARAQSPGFGSPDAVSSTNDSAPADMGDQAIAPMIGVAGGGRTTPGGLYVAGHYYYQLSDQDWFDGSAAFLFGSGDADCFRDRMDTVICEHGLADGYGVKVVAAARRFVPALSSGSFWPFVRLGVGSGIARFSDDDITGITFSLEGGAGMRASITETIALVAGADLELGLGTFGNGVGAEPQLGVHISAGAEFKL